MKSGIKSLLVLTAAMLVAGPVAHAQEISTSLPLTSVGDKLMWSVGDQNLQLNVPVTGQIRLELYSPQVDPADYRSDTYYGDETYNPQPVTSTFTLVNAEGKEVLSKTFTPGPHTWETLINQALPAGQYSLKVSTQGNGKNTFAVRLAGISADLSAERLSVNIHSQEWTPALNVTTDGAGYVLKMYDGDGPRELEVRLRDASGNVYPLPVSADLNWTELPIPAGAGQYTIELRQPQTAKQYSNTVSFSLTRAGAPTPLTVSKVDQTGLLHVTAELVLPTGSTPTGASVLVGGNTLPVQGEVTQRMAAGQYPVSAADIPGAEVSIDRQGVDIVKGQTSEVRVQVKPQVNLTLSADKQDVCLGDTVTLTARAGTAYQGDLPMTLTLDAPGLTLNSPASLEGPLSAAKPGELQVTATATASGPLTVSARLAPWEKAQELQLNVLPAGTSLQLTRLPLEAAQPGQTVTVTLRVTNTASVAVPFTLQDHLPAGLSALSDTSFTGTLAAGETRDLTYQAKVTADIAGEQPLQATLNSSACPAPQQVSGSVQVNVPAPEPRTAPQVMRRSVISLPFDAPSQTQTLTIAQELPAGATYVPGSSQLDGKTISDPKRGPSGTLYWTIPAPTGNGTEKGAALRGTVTYDVNHAEALSALPKPTLAVQLSGNRSEVLEGSLNAQDYAAAGDLNAGTQNTLAENDGAIKLPLANSVVRIRDRISITVEAPQGDIPTLTVNGKPVSGDLIGTNTQDGVRGVQRLTFVGVPVETGKNVITFLGEQITVSRVGATARLDVQPISTVADGSTPLRFKIRAFDAFDQLTDQPSVTVGSNLEPRLPDANRSEAGYQVKLVNGEGILELQPQSAPATLKLELLLNNKVQPYTFEVRPDRSQVGVGMLSATVGLDGNFSLQDDLNWQARGYYEGPIGDGKLYIAADKDNLPTDENTLTRYPVYGDASTESVPLQGIDPVALTYDHPSFRVDYRRTALPVDVLPLGERITALTVRSKSHDGLPEVSGFVAAVPADRIDNVTVTPTGTRVLHLPDGNISAGSETLQLVTLERGTGKELGRVTLTRNADYTLDVNTGVVTLARALDHVDLELNEQVIVASYRLDDPMQNRKLAYGVQVKKTGQNYSIGAAAVSLDDTVTVGARATYQTDTTKASASVQYAGGVQVAADLTRTSERQTFGAQVRYQQAGYKGLGKFADGLNASANYGVKLTDRLSVIAAADYHRTPSSSKDPITGISTPDVKQGGSVSARAQYELRPFSVGLGAKYAFGDQQGFGAIGSVGYHNERVNVDVVHTQPLSGNLNPVTDLSAKFKVARNANLGFTDKLEWGIGHSAALTLDTMLGNVNYAVAYELPTASGAGNRARFSVGTTLPLTDRLTAGVRGSALYSIQTGQAEVGAGTDLNYKTDRLSATIGTDLNYKTDLGFGVTVRGGITGSVSDELTLTADGLLEYGQDKNGQRLSLGYAYRARTLNSLGYVRYLNGTLAGNNPELSTGLSAEYRQPNWSVRGALDTRTLLKDPGSFTWQAGVAATAYVTDYLGLTAWGRMTGQPASSYFASGYGVEGSLRVMPGTWLSAGYNLKGFDGLPSAGMYTKQGAYLRLDLTLDETAGGVKK